MMIIVHTPSPTDVESAYGFWAVVGPVPEDFDSKGLPVEKVSHRDILQDPFRFDQIRYWRGPAEEILRLLKDLHPAMDGGESARELGRALF